MASRKGKAAKVELQLDAATFDKLAADMQLADSSLEIARRHFVGGETVPQIEKTVSITKARIYNIIRRIKNAHQEATKPVQRAEDLIMLPPALRQYLSYLKIAQTDNIGNADYLQGLDDGLKARLAGHSIEYRNAANQADRDYNAGLETVVRLGRVIAKSIRFERDV